MNAQTESYLKMIEYATKAPSGHNTQPWKFRVQDNFIEIIPDYSKTLTVVDTDNRELFISLGCATENLCIAASALGYTSQVDIRKDSVIVVHLNKSEIIKQDSLFEQINKRQTNRSIYDYKHVDDNTLNKCIASIEPIENISISKWENGSQTYEQIKEYILAGNTLQMNDKKFVDELKQWMRYNKKDSESQKDGLSYAAFGAPNLPAFISKPAMSSFLNSKKQNKGDTKKIESSSHFILLSSKTDNITEWIATGRYLERLLLRLTQEDIAHAYMNQPCEVTELREELQKTMVPEQEYPQILLRVGYAKPMPYSKRKEIKDVIVE